MLFFNFFLKKITYSCIVYIFHVYKYHFTTWLCVIIWTAYILFNRTPIFGFSGCSKFFSLKQNSVIDLFLPHMSDCLPETFHIFFLCSSIPNILKSSLMVIIIS